jgi:hypothetical protein
MQNIEALKELLRMAHEQLDSQKAENDDLKVRIAELEKELEWTSVKDCDLKPNTMYLIKCHDGEWHPFLFNVDFNWKINNDFFPAHALNGLDKVLMKAPKALKEQGK